jgi:hypothetical protein
MIRIHRGLLIAALGFALPAIGAFDTAAARGLTRAGGSGFAARSFAPPRWIGRPLRPHSVRRRDGSFVAPFYGYGDVPGFGGVIVVLPQQPASAPEPAPPPAPACKRDRKTVEVPAEGGGTRKVSVTRCADG